MAEQPKSTQIEPNTKIPGKGSVPNHELIFGSTSLFGTMLCTITNPLAPKYHPPNNRSMKHAQEHHPRSRPSPPSSDHPPQCKPPPANSTLQAASSRCAPRSPPMHPHRRCAHGHLKVGILPDRRITMWSKTPSHGPHAGTHEPGGWYGAPCF